MSTQQRLNIHQLDEKVVHDDNLEEKLSFLIDNVPTQNSDNLVKSGGVYDAIAALGGQGGGDAKQIIIDTIYPVGSIYLSVNDVNPSILFGGAWAVWGQGRVPVGVDTSQTEFNMVEKTGGAKTHTLVVNEMPSHTHTQNSHTHNTTLSDHNHEIPYINAGGGTANFRAGLESRTNTNISGTYPCLPSNSNWTGGGGGGAVMSSSSVTPAINNTGGGGAHNNLQPYITCYMWKRTA